MIGLPLSRNGARNRGPLQEAHAAESLILLEDRLDSIYQGGLLKTISLAHAMASLDSAGPFKQ